MEGADYRLMALWPDLRGQGREERPTEARPVLEPRKSARVPLICSGEGAGPIRSPNSSVCKFNAEDVAGADLVASYPRGASMRLCLSSSFKRFQSFVGTP